MFENGSEVIRAIDRPIVPRRINTGFFSNTASFYTVFIPFEKLIFSAKTKLMKRKYKK